MQKFLILIILTLLLVSCNDKVIFLEYKTLPGVWNKDSIITFKLNVEDSINPKNLFINLRNNSSYRYSNLFLITEMNFPNGKVIADTLEYDMAYPNGNYLGEGFGDVKENKLWYKENIKFIEDGDYTLTIRQAMRENDNAQGIDNLKGITEVGMLVEKTSE